MAGLLFVYMTPQPGLSLPRFHEWYNNEHGPTRLRLPHIFSNGLRYSSDFPDDKPLFLAIYDVTSMHYMHEPEYTSLRANRSPREAEVIAQVTVDRRFYDLVDSTAIDTFVPADHEQGNAALGRKASIVETSSEADARVSMRAAQAQAGWLRSRIFRAADPAQNGAAWMALHDFSATAAPPAGHVLTLFYIFGPAPRDLASLAALPATQAFCAADGSLASTPGAWPVLEGGVRAADGLCLGFRLEGAVEADAPVLVFCNSLLTSLHMWDGFVEVLRTQRPGYRILRYDQRGRVGLPVTTHVTPAVLADDVVVLLDALRIPRAHAVVGVSLGGVTTLCFAINHATRLSRYVACDFNVCGSAANTAAWKDRVAVAEADDGAGLREKLAPATVKRWFHEESMKKTEIVQTMTNMVAQNDLEGFRYGCRALWEYDLRDGMPGCVVPARFVAGEGDAGGKFLTIMKAYEGQVGYKDAEFRAVPKTGHLPMTEDAEAFWEAVKDFI
ncbi:hypothetical protein TD95_001636 [Thielaviopsis punctulata]|uniref:AB hydrolase-1 domain-containing protein n=1 Tax=Thielaviopsis punctulata TaxID=72032 RepID=A0A0F4Z8L6_9PEZI|nr:hypothetical protein TD95_001636 [Thielaviopsis punctulata]